MKPEAVEAANAAYKRARAALDKMEPFGSKPAPKDMPTVLECWSDLLAYGNRVYGKLEQGAKRGPADAWFRALKEERRTDPLLHYLHEARNADDHGITAIADPGHSSQFASIEGGQPITMFSRTGLAKDLEFAPHPNVTKTLALLPISAGRGELVRVPNHHLGSHIPESTPLAFAQLFLKRLEEILVEAQQWVGAATPHK